MSDTATQLRDYIIPLADRSDVDITSKIRDTGGVEVLLARVFDQQVSQFNPEVAGDHSAVIQWKIKDADGVHAWHIDVANGRADNRSGTAKSRDVTLTINAVDFVRLIAGKIDAMQAFTSGKLKITGDVGVAQAMMMWFGGNRPADREPLDRPAFQKQFNKAIDDLERALRGCPDELWEASAWRVSKTDPWMWPKKGTKPIPERTEESIQAASAVWAIAYHCLWFLDFYASIDGGFQSPEYVRGGPEEQGMAADGAAPIPRPVFSRDVLLKYLDYGRQRIADTINNVTDDELRKPVPKGHPHFGKTFQQLLEVNLAHVREHGGDLLAFVPPSKK